MRGFGRSGRRGSNPRHLAWEASALPAELRPRSPHPSRDHVIDQATPRDSRTHDRCNDGRDDLARERVVTDGRPWPRFHRRRNPRQWDVRAGSYETSRSASPRGICIVYRPLAGQRRSTGTPIERRGRRCRCSFGLPGSGSWDCASEPRRLHAGDEATVLVTMVVCDRGRPGNRKLRSRDRRGRRDKRHTRLRLGENRVEDSTTRAARWNWLRRPSCWERRWASSGSGRPLATTRGS